MTIKITYGAGDQFHSSIYRKIYKGRNLAEHVESFYALREAYQWGRMYQLKGKQIIKLHEFGTQ